MKHNKEINKADKFTGYPEYPAEDDIYNKGKKVNLDPDDLSKNKERMENLGKRNEKDFSESPSGGDLDIPGSELDAKQEKIGSGDEENSFYGSSGDNDDSSNEEMIPK